MGFVPFLLAVLAGFAMIRVPVEGTFLAGLNPFLDIIGILAVIVFSVVIIVKAIPLLWNKNIN